MNELTTAELEYLILKCEEGIQFADDTDICMRTLKAKLKNMQEELKL